MFRPNGGDKTRQQNMKQTPVRQHKIQTQSAHREAGEKTYKANRATVAASYFAKSIEKVNNTSERSSEF